jgi:hypothetical protein
VIHFALMKTTGQIFLSPRSKARQPRTDLHFRSEKMAWLEWLFGIALILIILVDTFEVIILPRRIRRDFRLARQFYRGAWKLWRLLAPQLPPGRWRNGLLSIFGPLSLVVLLAIWAAGLIFGFALLQWSLHTPLFHKTEAVEFGTYLYFSGTTFFTLGLGDLVPAGSWGRFLCVLESGIGFGFLALVISYLPVLYQAFSRREITISLLDARAGSPPTAGELLRRFATARSVEAIRQMLVEWERWAAELLESHLSFPVLSYYRSQHDNQSWIGALTTILDSAALLIAAQESAVNYQARLTFAMARHAAVDLAMVFHVRPRPLQPDRLATNDLAELLRPLEQIGLTLGDQTQAINTFQELRMLYEPIVSALAVHLLMDLPGIQPAKTVVDNWQTSPWLERAPGLTRLSQTSADSEHFG